jgi:hypothetical protein
VASHTNAAKWTPPAAKAEPLSHDNHSAKRHEHGRCGQWNGKRQSFETPLPLLPLCARSGSGRRFRGSKSDDGPVSAAPHAVGAAAASRVGVPASVSPKGGWPLHKPGWDLPPDWRSGRCGGSRSAHAEPGTAPWCAWLRPWSKPDQIWAWPMRWYSSCATPQGPRLHRRACTRPASMHAVDGARPTGPAAGFASHSHPFRERRLLGGTPYQSQVGQPLWRPHNPVPDFSRRV